MSDLKYTPFKFRKPRLVLRKKKAVHIFEREGIIYYVNSKAHVLLNPEDIDNGSGILLVKPLLTREISGIYFTETPMPTDEEFFAAEVAYLYAIGKPRKGYKVVPITLFPGYYDHSPENIQRLHDAGDMFSRE